jgi:AraC-like DNA-binding protein
MKSLSSHPSGRIRLPLLEIPRIHLAYRNTLEDRDFATEYSAKEWSLHLCDYEGFIRIGRENFPIRPGDVTVTPAHISRSYHLRKPGTHLAFAFVPVKFDARRKDLLELPLHQSLGRAGGLAKLRFLEAIQMHARGQRNPLAAANARVKLQELLLWLAMQSRGDVADGGSALDRSLNETIDQIDWQYHRALSVAGLARQVGLSQNYLARRFKQRYGMTIQHYLLILRMKHAHELLLSTNLPVKSIGQRVGMADPQYFNKQFRAAFGKSPTEIRRK